MNRFMEKIRRKLISEGLPGDYVYRVEPQKRGAPHTHILFQGRHDRKSMAKLGGKSKGITWGWAISPMEFDKFWLDTLRDAGYPITDVRAACNLQRVKKSVVAYMSKYMTKATPKATVDDPGTEVNRESHEVHPSSWWGMSSKLRKAIKDRIIRVVRAVSDEFSWHLGVQVMGSVAGNLFTHLNEGQNGEFKAIVGRAKAGRMRQVLYAFNSL
jgi:hypothetical protein